MTSVSINPAKEGVITYLHARLSKDETPDAMEESLEGEILEKIPGDVSGMYVGNGSENSIPIIG